MENKIRVEKSQALRRDLESVIGNLKKSDVDADVKVSVYDIKTRISAHVNGRDSGWAASVIKVPIMVATLQKVEKGFISFDTDLAVDHDLILEPYDQISKLPNGSLVPVQKLLDTMMIHSDNTATNMLARRVGIQYINRMMWDLGMNQSMLGHLLCPDTKRYTSDFNSDGSNLLCTRDMAILMRNIYDQDYSELSKFVRSYSDRIFSQTHAGYIRKPPFLGSKIKAKVGFISDPRDGSDMHETGIIDNRLIVSIMLNKIDQNRILATRPSNEELGSALYSGSFFQMKRRTPVDLVYAEVMRCIGKHFGYKNNIPIRII